MSFVASVLASIPSPSENGIEIGPLNLRAYGLLIAFGVIAGVRLIGKNFEAERIGTRDDAASLATWGVVAGVIGARLYHVATDWSRFSDDLGSIPAIWKGGLGIPGGLLLGLLVTAWQANKRGIDVPTTLTCVVPAVALAQAIGRWGNWFNQELYGRATELPWALEIDDAHLPNGAEPGTTFHPTFLYESLWNFALCAVLLWVHRRFRLAPGRLVGVYLVGYGVGRFWIEGLRIDRTHDLGGLRWNQWVALGAVVGGALYLVCTRGARWPTPDAEAADDADGDVADQVEVTES